MDQDWILISSLAFLASHSGVKSQKICPSHLPKGPILSFSALESLKQLRITHLRDSFLFHTLEKFSQLF